MSLATGTRIGPYEIVSALGAGGMGEVYRARDTRLKREVALKVLPAAVAADAERLARFQREAEVLAALNHPHIAHVHGVEDAPLADGTVRRALVMELVEGDDLAQRLARGPLPLDEALAIARQIADALEAAHQQGIVHRDLKPANIKVRPDGIVKVLDFGLAKATEPEAQSDLLKNSPTFTSPAMLTRAGVILGTAAYMSPEQARGRAIDHRADIWAFGCVLYELLVGRAPFVGDGVSDTLAEVLKSDPDWAALPRDAPRAIRRLLQRCLAKDLGARVPSMAVVRYELEEALQQPAGGEEPTPLPVGRRAKTARLAAAAVGGLMLAGALWTVTRDGAYTTVSPPAARFVVSPPNGVEFGRATQPIAITPDGTRIVFIGEGNGTTRYFVRPLDRLEATPIPGTDNVRASIAMSPDGQSFAVVDMLSGVIKKFRIDGGASETLAQLPNKAEAGFRGSTWGSNGQIVYAMPGDRGLMMVPAAGGQPQRLTEAADEFHGYPHFLPDGRQLLFCSSDRAGVWRVSVLDLATRNVKVLLNGVGPHYVASGHLLFVNDNRLWAVPFDLDRVEVRGDPIPVLEDVAIGVPAQFSVSRNGTLVYTRGYRGVYSPSKPVIVDAQRNETALPNVPTDVYSSVRVSPSGRWLSLFGESSGVPKISIYDLKRGSTTRVADGYNPVWTADERTLLYSRARGGSEPPGLYSQPVDGAGRAERVVALPDDVGGLFPDALAPDGAHLIVTAVRAGGIDLDLASLREATARPLLNSEFLEADASLSPNGRWLAYHSDRSGPYQVFVARFPELTDQQQVSIEAGRSAIWARDGSRLFYRSDDGRRVFEVIATGNDRLAFSAPRQLLEGEYQGTNAWGGKTYDVMPDGKRFVMLKPNRQGWAETDVVVVQNWLEELRRRVPVSR